MNYGNKNELKKITTFKRDNNFYHTTVLFNRYDNGISYNNNIKIHDIFYVIINNKNNILFDSEDFILECKLDKQYQLANLTSIDIEVALAFSAFKIKSLNMDDIYLNEYIDDIIELIENSDFSYKFEQQRLVIFTLDKFYPTRKSKLNKIINNIETNLD